MPYLRKKGGKPRMMVALLLAVLAPVTASGDGIMDVWVDAFSPPAAGLFPNWIRAEVAEFGIGECDDVTCPGCTASSITGLTLVNIGSAVGNPGVDIDMVYFRILCDKSDSGTLTMTYAGIYQQSTGSFPAWTWAGTSPISGDPCSDCACLPILSVFVDVAGCPGDGVTIQMGVGCRGHVSPSAS